MLGIELKIEDASLKKTKKDLSKSTGTTQTRGVAGGRVRKGGKMDVASSAGIGAALGGFAGGIIGAIVSSLKPIRQLLEIIGGFLTIALNPILILLKPFLVLFLKLGLALNKWLGGLLGGGKIGGGSASQTLDKFKIDEVNDGLEGFLDSLGNFSLGILGIIGDIAMIFVEFGMKIGQALWDGFIVPVGEWIAKLLIDLYDIFIVPMTDFVSKLIENFGIIFKSLGNFFALIGIKIWEFIKNGLKFINFLGEMMWGVILIGLNTIKDLGNRIWEFIKTGLSAVAQLGTMIVNYVKEMIARLNPFGGGKASGGYVSGNTPYLVGENGPEVFMPTNSGNIIPNNEISMGGGQTININVTGFVGNEDELADTVSKALNDRQRGGTVSY